MTTTPEFTVSGDADHIYVSDRNGHVVAFGFVSAADAERFAGRLNEDARDCSRCGKPMMWSRFLNDFRHTVDGTRECGR